MVETKRLDVEPKSLERAARSPMMRRELAARHGITEREVYRILVDMLAAEKRKQKKKMLKRGKIRRRKRSGGIWETGASAVNRLALRGST